jgi:hypothetical protein
MMAEKIFWTTEERSKLSEEMVKLFTLDLNLARRRALGGAQLVLPQSRRRRVTDQIAFTQRLLIEAARNRARGTVHATPVPVVSAPPVPQPLQELVKSELGSALEHLIDLVVDRVLARVQSRLTTDKASAGPAVPTYDAAAARANAALRNAPSPQRAPRPGVLIIGLLGAQVTETIAAFPHLDITHMTGEEGLTRPALLRAHTVLMTKFINHSVQGKYRKAPNLHFCNGGVSELRRMLSEIGQGVKC